MCIGLSMRVTATEPGHAHCQGRGETRRVRTDLLGQVAVGDYLLVFLDSARERLDAQRAAEIDATLDLMQSLLHGDGLANKAVAPPAFELPSTWTVAQLRALSGASADPTP